MSDIENRIEFCNRLASGVDKHGVNFRYMQPIEELPIASFDVAETSISHNYKELGIKDLVHEQQLIIIELQAQLKRLTDAIEFVDMNDDKPKPYDTVRFFDGVEWRYHENIIEGTARFISENGLACYQITKRNGKPVLPKSILTGEIK